MSCEGREERHFIPGIFLHGVAWEEISESAWAPWALSWADVCYLQVCDLVWCLD